MGLAEKRLGGKRAHANGASFEAIFQASCARHSVIATRIPDGCRQLASRIIRVKSPFDWILTYKGKTALIDTKSIGQESFPHSLIDINQTLTLIRHQAEGAIAGYIVWLRKSGHTIFIPASVLCKSMQSRGSINQSTEGVHHIGMTFEMDPRAIFAYPHSFDDNLSS